VGCSQDLDIYLYLTDLCKFIPENQNGDIQPSNANTGFTYACNAPYGNKNEICIFREEEWFKVLIHETVHSFGIDFSSSVKINDYANQRITALFGIPVVSQGYSIFESYTEICAEIMNLLFYQKIHKINDKKWKEHLYIEQLFSCFQCAKVLNLPNKKGKDYKENTDIFSYYILKSILIYEIDDFLEWIMTPSGNAGSIVFKRTHENIKTYCDIIERGYLNPKYKQTIEKMDNWIKKNEHKKRFENQTLRMTVLEYS